MISLSGVIFNPCTDPSPVAQDDAWFGQWLIGETHTMKSRGNPRRLSNLPGHCSHNGSVLSRNPCLCYCVSDFDAELALTDTHRLHLVSVVQLYKALGGGWSPDSPEETIAISGSSS